MHNYPVVRCARFFCTLAIVMAAASTQVAAQAFSPFSQFQSLTTAQLSTLQMKLTFVGESEKPTKSVLFTAAGEQPDLSKFVPFYRPGISYAADQIAPRSVASPVSELAGLLSQLANDSVVVAGGAAAAPRVSFSMVQTGASGTIGFEALLGDSDSRTLIDIIRAALASDQVGIKATNLFACSSSVPGTSPPADVTSSFNISYGGARLNRATGRYVASLTITNSTTAPITGPVNAVIKFQGSVRIFNAYGYTCLVPPEGLDILAVTFAGNVIAPGAAVQVLLDMLNPNSEPIQPVIKLYAGFGDL